LDKVNVTAIWIDGTPALSTWTRAEYTPAGSFAATWLGLNVKDTGAAAVAVPFVLSTCSHAGSEPALIVKYKEPGVPVGGATITFAVGKAPPFT